MQEIQNRIKGNMTDFFKDMEAKTAKASSLNMNSTKKMISKKSKTEKIEGEDLEKRKINYNLKDESDGDSDS